MVMLTYLSIVNQLQTHLISGIVAVGLLEGRLLLIDLNMDETAESKELSAAGIYFISPATREVSRYR